MADIIRIVVVGPVSTGKSTLINSIFINQYSDMKIKKTTMLPQVYQETRNKLNIMDAKIIYSKNTTINENILTNKIKLTNETCKEIIHYIPQITDIIRMPDDVYLEIYDLPGLDDGKQEEIYFNYLRENFNKFDIILFNIDINEALNTSGSVRILDELINNINKSYNKKFLYIIINKCDNMDFNINNELILDDEELEEMYDQIVSIVNEKTQNNNECKNIHIEFLKLSALDSYVYRMLNKNPDSKLDTKDRDKFGINEVGKTKWKKMCKKEKLEFIKNCLSENYEEKLVSTGFQNFINIFNKTLSLENQIYILQGHLCNKIINYFNNLSIDNITPRDILLIINTTNDFYDSIISIKKKYSLENIIKLENCIIMLIKYISTYFNEFCINCIDNQDNIMLIDIFNKFNKNLVYESSIKFNNTTIYKNLIYKSIHTTIYKNSKDSSIYNIKKVYEDTICIICTANNNNHLSELNSGKIYSQEEYFNKFENIFNILHLISNNNNYINKTDIIELEVLFDIISNNILTYTPKIFTFEDYTTIMKIVDYFHNNLDNKKIQQFYENWLYKKYLDYDKFISYTHTTEGNLIEDTKIISFLRTYDNTNILDILNMFNIFKPLNNNTINNLIDIFNIVYSESKSGKIELSDDNNHKSIYKLLIGKLLFYINIYYYNTIEKELLDNNIFTNILKMNNDINKAKSLQFNSLFENTKIDMSEDIFSCIETFNSLLNKCKISYTHFDILKDINDLKYTDFIQKKEFLSIELKHYYNLFNSN